MTDLIYGIVFIVTFLVGIICLNYGELGPYNRYKQKWVYITTLGYMLVCFACGLMLFRLLALNGLG